MLGQPVTMLIPQVIGFRLTGALPAGATATDLVLTVTEMLRKKGVVDKFVEFFGDGLAQPAAGRPRDHRQHGARVRQHLRHLPDRRGDAPLPRAHRPSRRADRAGGGLCKAQGLWRTNGMPEAAVHRHRSSSTSRPSSRAWPARSGRRTACRCASPRRPIASASARWQAERASQEPVRQRARPPVTSGGKTFDLVDGAVLIAAITSCTNTSNPYVLMAAGLLARNARRARPDVASPGSRPASRRARAWSPTTCSKAGLLADLERARLQPRRLRLHHLHRQLRAAAPEISDGRAQAGDVVGRLGAVRQPQLRGPRAPRGEDELPRLAAAGRGLRARRHASTST